MHEQLKEFVTENNIDTIIETGTHVGGTTRAFSGMVPAVISIELKFLLYLAARWRLKNIKNIRLFLGNSADVLRKILPRLNHRKLLFFLDAHWYENPLLSELKSISEFVKRPCIVIHDFKVPSRPDLGYDFYKENEISYEVQYILDSLDEIYGGRENYSYSYNSMATGVKRGCIFITPG